MTAAPSPVRLHGALFTVALLFSVNYIISKIGMREFAPLSFAWLRVAGSAAVLLLLARNEPRMDRSDRVRVTGFAILGVVINQSLFLGGLAFTSVHAAALLITTIPVFALGAAILTGGERASTMRIGGITLAGAGALLVIGGERIEGTPESALGAAMIVANCLSFALYLVLSKPTMARLSARSVVSWMFAAGTVLLLPISARSLMREEWSQISMTSWISLLLVIAGPTVSAYLLNAWALRHADSSVVAAYTYVQPILATILGALLLDETINRAAMVAGLMIFGGVWLAGRATGPVPE